MARILQNGINRSISTCPIRGWKHYAVVVFAAATLISLIGRVPTDAMMGDSVDAVDELGEPRCGYDESECDIGLLCEYSPGTCHESQRQGTCISHPLICPEDAQPVCGCDGVTYRNDCERQHFGASVAHERACVDTTECGGLLGLPCPVNERCETPAGMCEADSLGVCDQQPTACPDVVEPVCGCDGRTFTNDCERKRGGVALDHIGPC